MAGAAAGDAVCLQSVSEVVGAKVAPRVAAGKQPSAATGGTVNLERDLGEGFGSARTPLPSLIATASGSAWMSLAASLVMWVMGGVEQEEAYRETISRVKRGVRQQAAQNLYALQVGKRDGLARGLRPGDVQLNAGTVAFEPNDE